MPVYALTEDIAFPHPDAAEPDGLLAVGGDLSPERLLHAYALGIFPWPHKGMPLLWFSPDPRMVLLPDRLKASRSLRQVIQRGRYRITFDAAFAQVVQACRTVPRPGQPGTWITRDMQRAYTALHELGFAHSAEAWRGDELVGGLYGVSLGAAFFGESMFSLASDAGKAAFVTLAARLFGWGFQLVDAQVHTKHLERFGAGLIPRSEYLKRLDEALKRPTKRGRWRNDLDGKGVLAILKSGPC